MFNTPVSVWRQAASAATATPGTATGTVAGAHTVALTPRGWAWFFGADALLLGPLLAWRAGAPQRLQAGCARVRNELRSNRLHMARGIRTNRLNHSTHGSVGRASRDPAFLLPPRATSMEPNASQFNLFLGTTDPGLDGSRAAGARAPS